MTPMLKIQRREVPADAGEFGAELHPVLRRVYVARGLRTRAELDLSLERLAPVGSLGGAVAAAQLLARHAGRRVLIVGDFDADGATSTALMVRALRSCGFAAVDFLVPNRFEYGYGLTPEIVAVAAQRAPSLIVTVDNGIGSHAGVAAARARGIEVLITDHHLPGADLPDANVIVNPNVPGNGFASGALAGVGVAFYVCAALRRLLAQQHRLPSDAPPTAAWLDLVALGTVADVAPLDANNRVLVAQGVARIRAGRCVPGIAALLAVARRARAEVVATDLGFAVAPRLNAAGRLSDMSVGIRCLLTDDAAEAAALATQLDALNAQRREIEADMQLTALAAVRALRTGAGGTRRAGVCLFDAGWHQGVVGLVAGRVKEQLRRPVVAFALADERTLRGSARSVPGVHVRDVLEAVATREPGLLEKFGGHAMAAGLTLARDQLDRFARAFDVEVARAMAAGAVSDAIETDGELSDADIALPLAEALRAGGPWGAAFPEPLFDGEFELRGPPRVLAGRHLKFQVAAREGRGGFEAIAFNSVDPERPEPMPRGRVRMVYRLGTNEYQGERRLQLVVEHLLPA
ncbi:MAG: single-stranded-DNA-specific exonuclease RecJ [Proteobacteria bacterium]|nr:single-stranded-DNA-specific exonuclease RecJ [Pseudomonadota bacterium]